MTENTFEHPGRVAIREKALEGAGPSMSYQFPPHSVTILELYRQ